MENILIFDLVIFAIVLLFYKFYPKEINPMFGYRTKESMKSEKKWLFAQQFFSKRWLYVIPIILITQIPLLFDKSLERYLLPISIAQFLIISLYGMYVTEKALKKIDN